MHRNIPQDSFNMILNQLEKTKILSNILSDHWAVKIKIDTDIINTWKKEYALING